MSGKYHVRSISLPTRSNPATLEVEEALNKIKAWESSPTSGSFCNGLSGVEELCKYVDKLLNLASTQEVLSHNQKGKCHEELLDGSVRLLDVCSISRDILLRKKMKKDAKKLIASLKQMDNKHGASSLLDQDQHLSAVIRVIREVNPVKEKEENDNELVAVYAALSEESDSEKVKITYKKLEALLTSIEDLESCLERVFRILIKTRSSLLNLISL
ncbi:hypothetical protein OIU78_020670 [Salix suchowensis]|nr:hypothetical protein OIU78_020670 [Salix suchowensis]